MKRIIFAVSFALILTSSLNLLGDSKKLVTASVIFRHGDRTPTKPININSYDWGLGLGELTPLGMKQEYELGTFFRKRYIEELKLITKNYDVNSLYVRTSNINRTLMSAESVLYGLYPAGTGPVLKNGEEALPYRYQPVPVNSAELSSDILLHSDHIYEKLLKKIITKYVFGSKTWLDKQKEVEKYFPLWSRISGLRIKELDDAESFSAYMYICSLKGVILPKEIDTPEQKAIILPLAAWISAQKYEPQITGYIVANKLIERIIETSNESLEGYSKYKLFLYSAHDTNILAVMSALKVPLNENPHYSSFLAFEIYQDEAKYYLKVVYNNDDVNLPIKDEGGYYEWEDFIRYYAEIDNAMSEKLKTLTSINK
ncbi:MAG TPA: acid phosphatase [Lentisphaeria bacterium]|nr:MAG: hypothetical protein A2X47_06325 [Lentisphaerae bacterium GWF2_38_69]HBM15706.1 acid phosphatase [Lentisphaeria bacterium]